ncbi:MAG: cellulase family glycosylhydrolase [Fimbriimonas sp.]
MSESLLTPPPAVSVKRQWSVADAVAWQARQPWVVGCNFIPSTAINQLEMWQAETFDPATIDRELGWAASLGMNGVRIYLHDLLYEADPEGFLDRVDRFLDLAAAHGIRALVTFFDDCWDPEPRLGPQPLPRVGVHNGGWVSSPAKASRNWPADLPRLERYVKGTLERFAEDDRVYMWDLYNEPGNKGYDVESLDLLRHAFDWAWAVRPSQPLTAAIWFEHDVLNEFQATNSDVVSFHDYNPDAKLRGLIDRLKAYGRPLACTEWMARTSESRVESHLPIFHAEGIACFNWGLVVGKTNTHYSWTAKAGDPEPELWFHDLFRPDGSPYNVDEAALFRRLTGRGDGKSF